MRLCVIASFTVLSARCGSTVVSADAAVPTDLALLVDVTAPVDAPPAVDASRCDPSVLDDASVDDAGTPSIPYVTSLAIGGGHRCALMSDRTVRCAGSNLFGALGLGSSADPMFTNTLPTTVPGLRGVAQLVVNDFSSTCARLDDGSVRCWGNNHLDSLGVGHDGDDECAYADSHYPCRTRPTPVPGLTDVVDLAGGMVGFCAVRADGTVWCWGHGVNIIGGGAAPTPRRAERYTDAAGISGSRLSWIVRLRDGSLDLGLPLQIPTHAEMMANPLSGHFCWRLADTSLRCVGTNAFGQLGSGAVTSVPFEQPVDPGLCSVRGGAAGSEHTCAVLADRRVSCWGNVYGPRRGGGAIEPDRCVGVLGEESCTLRPTVIAGVDRVDRVFTGYSSTCALRLDRSVWCWGGLSPNEDQSPGPVQW